MCRQRPTVGSIGWWHRKLSAGSTGWMALSWVRGIAPGNCNTPGNLTPRPVAGAAASPSMLSLLTWVRPPGSKLPQPPPCRDTARDCGKVSPHISGCAILSHRCVVWARRHPRVPLFQPFPNKIVTCDCATRSITIQGSIPWHAKCSTRHRNSCIMIPEV
jgi:hypothetical protein